MADTPRYVGWRLFDHHVKHDGGGHRKAIPTSVSRLSGGKRAPSHDYGHGDLARAQDLPRKDVLCVVVAEIHLSRPPNGNATGMVI
jgi:hypothetical protein